MFVRLHTRRARSHHVAQPAHLHYFYHGCSSRYVGGAGKNSPDVRRFPRRACGHRNSYERGLAEHTHTAHGKEHIAAQRGDGRHTSHRYLTAHYRVAGRLLGFGQSRSGAAGGTGGGAAVGGAGGSVGGSTTRYTVEWVSSAPLGARPTSSVPLSALCGGGIELVERCHAQRWPGVTDAEGSASDAGQQAERRTTPRARYFEALNGERWGCGTDTPER
jgi:hypothetical protein